MSVSVVMPTYQSARFIGAAIASVRAQIFTDWELIVVDDGSTDGTQEIVRAINDPRLRFIEQSENEGPAKARRIGTQEARFEAVCYLDSDDILYPDALLNLHAVFARHPLAAMVYSHYARIDARGMKTGLSRFLPRPCRPSGEALKAFLKKNYLANGGCALCRRAFVLEAGCWDQPRLPCAEDWVAWVLLATRGPFVFLPYLTALGYRELRTGLSRSVNATFDNAKPALDFVFSHPRVKERFPLAQLTRFRTAREASMWTYIAQLQARAKDWRKSRTALKIACHLDPAAAPVALVKYALAVCDAFRN